MKRRIAILKNVKNWGVCVSSCTTVASEHTYNKGIEPGRRQDLRLGDPVQPRYPSEERAAQRGQTDVLVEAPLARRVERGPSRAQYLYPSVVSFPAPTAARIRQLTQKAMSAETPRIRDSTSWTSRSFWVLDGGLM